MTVPGRTCACGCGAPVTGSTRWARGHSRRGEGGYTVTGTSSYTGRKVTVRAGPEPIPGPDDPELYDDVGVLVPDDAGLPDAPGDAEPAEPSPSRDAGPVTPDPPPAHGTRDWQRLPRPDRRPRAAARVTQVTRKDIDAKISLALTISGSVWAARDPLCGGTFMEQRPEISGALTEIVCQSPDLIAWFSGAGGQFMLWLNLAAACWPVATIVMAHHVYHTLEAGPDAEPDLARYAA